MTKVKEIVYLRHDKAKVYLSDGRQSPKINVVAINKWIADNKEEPNKS